MSKPKNSKDALEFIHTLDSLAIKKQKDEIERLKAEVERLTFDPLTYLDDHGEWMPRHIHLVAVERLEVRNAELVSENARLKAEVNALMTNPTSRLLRAKQAENAVLAIENDSLKAEVERLRKAGDEVIHEWSSGHGTDVENFTKALWVWTTAKEGKQS